MTRADLGHGYFHKEGRKITVTVTSGSQADDLARRLEMRHEENFGRHSVYSCGSKKELYEIKLDGMIDEAD